MKNNKSNSDEEYPINFRGAKLTKHEANRVGVGILFGLLGIIVIFLLPIKAKGILAYVILVIFFLIGYFYIAPKLFKK